MIKNNPLINILNPVFQGNNQDDANLRNTTNKYYYKTVSVENNGDTFTRTSVKNNGTERVSKFNSLYLKTHNPKDRYPYSVTLENYCGIIQEWFNTPNRHSIIVTIKNNPDIKEMSKDILEDGMAIYRENGIGLFEWGAVNPKSKMSSGADTKFKKLYRYVLSGKPKFMM